MNIEKALKWEKRLIKRFYIFMIVTSVSLPIIMLLAGINKLFYISYLIFIELLIVVSIVSKINFHRLKFSCSNNRLKYKSGLFSREFLILCDKVTIVHTKGIEDKMEVILVTNLKMRNKSVKPIGKAFLKKYPGIVLEYMAQKEMEPEKTYYYTIVKKGGLKKYTLLDSIYRNCVKAVYTEEAIQNIKISRGQTLV